MLQSNQAWAPQLLSHCSRAEEVQPLNPQATTAEAHTAESPRSAAKSHCNKKPVQGHERAAPDQETREKPTQQQRPNTAKDK